MADAYFVRLIPAIAGVLAGFKPVVVAIVVEAVVKIGGRALKRNAHYLIAALAFVSIYFLHIPFPLIVFAAGIIGLLRARYLPDIFSFLRHRSGSIHKNPGLH